MAHDTTETPERPRREAASALWRDPEDGAMRWRHSLGHCTAGKLQLREKSTGTSLFWTGGGQDEIERALSSSLFITMQTCRALSAVRAGRPAAKVYYPLQDDYTNWKMEEVNFLMVLAPARYLIEERREGGQELWQV